MAILKKHCVLEEHCREKLCAGEDIEADQCSPAQWGKVCTERALVIMSMMTVCLWKWKWVVWIMEGRMYVMKLYELPIDTEWMFFQGWNDRVQAKKSAYCSVKTGAMAFCQASKHWEPWHTLPRPHPSPKRKHYSLFIFNCCMILKHPPLPCLARALITGPIFPAELGWGCLVAPYLG